MAKKTARKSRATKTGSVRRPRARPSRQRVFFFGNGAADGDPASIQFFAKVGLDYVSASPYRIPTARLAAAHAALRPRDDAVE
jgi:phosphoenolpyruvate synthase/pyruvate phosphate dikinase